MAVLTSIVIHVGLFYLVRDLQLAEAAAAQDEAALLQDSRFEEQIRLDPKMLEQTLSTTTPELTDKKVAEADVTQDLPPVDQLAEHLKGEITLTPETAVPLNIEFKAKMQGETGSAVEAVSAVDTAIAGGVEKKIASTSANDVLKTAQAQDDQVTIRVTDKPAVNSDALKGELDSARKKGDGGLKGLGFSSLDDLLDLKTPQTGDMKTMIPSRTLFDYNSTELREEAKVELIKLGILLSTWTKAQFHVEGHTDTTGDDLYNIDLSRRRAQAVKDWVVNSLKVDGHRIFVHGFGETQPLVNPNGSQEQQELNRRVVIRIVNP